MGQCRNVAKRIQLSLKHSVRIVLLGVVAKSRPSHKSQPVPRIRFAIDREEFRREQVERSLAKLKKSEGAEKNGVVAK